MKKISILAVFAAAGSLFLASQAKANTESFTVNYGTEASPSEAPFTDNLNLSLFNPSLGTLTGVSLVLTSNISTNVEIVNFSGIPQTYSLASTSWPVTAATTFGLTATTTGATGIYPSGIAGPGLTNLPIVTQNNLQDTAIVGPSGFANYEGVGTFGLTVSGATFSTTGAGTGLGFGGAGNSYGNVEVEYSYTPSSVPDGGMTVALLGLSLVGLAGAEILRRKQFVRSAPK